MPMHVASPPSSTPAKPHRSASCSLSHSCWDTPRRSPRTSVMSGIRDCSRSAQRVPDVKRDRRRHPRIKGQLLLGEVFDDVEYGLCVRRTAYVVTRLTAKAT